MRVYYVDAENIGLSIIDDFAISVLDRFFVFTNSESLKLSCAEALLTCVSGYPSGKNQADFYIVAHLSNVLAHLSKAEKKAIEFVLCSKDLDLWRAFEFQCSLAGVVSISSHIAIDQECENIIEKVGGSIEERILKLMSQPMTCSELQQELKTPQSEFTVSFNGLIKSGKVKRQEGSKKKWLRVVGV